MYGLTEKMYHEIISRTMGISNIELRFSHISNRLVEITKYNEENIAIGMIRIYPKNISYTTKDNHIWITPVGMYDIFDEWRKMNNE